MKTRLIIWLVVLTVTMGMTVLQGELYGTPKSKKKKKGEQMETEKKLFLTTGLIIRKIVVVPAPVDDVWKAWTTLEGVKTYFAPEQPEGLRGGEGCKILSFVPGEMLSFTWNAPPSIPEVRKEKTWVVLTFQPLEGNKTQVSLVHLGWQAGEEWQKALKYFDRAWEIVLGRFFFRLQTRTNNWKKPQQSSGPA